MENANRGYSEHQEVLDSLTFLRSKCQKTNNRMTEITQAKVGRVKKGNMVE
ncbi:15012_t:CDS:2 [Cetraspora pellucida]|uniref:15012_t:CDS:1 n=1 Tax=Cetraspora pellucida TaxID=1433469 RepID=A0ACA9K0M8_9GLOM|nr:15012_t:CDS:2 [Cetraspora pellucida]